MHSVPNPESPRFPAHLVDPSGLHENLLQLRYFDAGLTRTAAVLSQLADADALLSRALRGGGATGGLLRYLPALLVQASALVASHERPALQWPRTASEARRAAAASSALLQAWRLRMAPALAAATGLRPLAVELLPALLHIAAPALRPVSQHLYTREEQAALRTLVSTLLSLGLRFAPEGTPEEPRFGFAEAHAAARLLAGPGEAVAAGAAAVAATTPAARGEPPLAFRPPVHRLGAFPGMAPKGRALPAAVRQAASHEADMEAIRQADRARAAAAAASNAPWGGASGGKGSPGPMEAGAASQQQQVAAICASQPAGPVPLTLAQRMAAAAVGKKAAKGGGSGTATRKGTWLDALKEQRLRAKAVGPGGGEGGGAAGRGKQFAVLYKFNEVRASPAALRTGMGITAPMAGWVMARGPLFAGCRKARIDLPAPRL